MADDSAAQWRVTDETIALIESIRDAFNDSDIAGDDGQLSIERLAALFQLLNSNLGPDEVHAAFSTIDKDQSGSVDIDEFFNFIFSLDAGLTVALEHRKGLHDSIVFCRIRPVATDGGHAEGEAVEMRLDGWRNGSIQVANRHEIREFTFPKTVIEPEATQEETFDLTMPQFLDAWLIKLYNVQLLAYGQTGTGKTHTMFGTRESLSSDDPHPDWGLFPRVVNHCLKTCAATYKIFTGRWMLFASAAEFYLGEAYDLLGAHRRVQLDKEGLPMGLASVEISAVSDLVPFLDTVNSTRTMSRTKMNAGSSRSHCALILTLYCTDHRKQEMSCTTFSVVDMAGSERISKTGAEFVAPTEVASKMSASKKPTAKQMQGIEGGLINFELSLLATEVMNATEAHQRRRRYVQPRGFATTDTMKFLGRALSGDCLMCMIVCISQAPQNGWETWFSCTYGESLARLKAPLKKGKVLKMDKELKAAESALAKATRELEDTHRGGAGKQQYLLMREAIQRSAQEYVDIMQQLVQPV